MKNIKTIERKIDDISKIASKDVRKLLGGLKTSVTSYSDKLYYEANYDKKLCIANYNKFIADVNDLDRENFYFIFIKVPDISLSYFLEGVEKENNSKFLNALKELTLELSLAKKNIYLVCDYLILIAYKNDANVVYNKVKALKNSKNQWKNFQTTYIRYRKYSGKINKNISGCMKQAYNIFRGVSKETNDWAED